MNHELIENKILNELMRLQCILNATISLSMYRTTVFLNHTQIEIENIWQIWTPYKNWTFPRLLLGSINKEDSTCVAYCAKLDKISDCVQGPYFETQVSLLKMRVFTKMTSYRSHGVRPSLPHRSTEIGKPHRERAPRMHARRKGHRKKG